MLHPSIVLSLGALAGAADTEDETKNPVQFREPVRLMAEGELSAGAIVKDAKMSAPAVSRHLKVLREAGLIRQRVDGTKRYYSVRSEALKVIADWTMDHRAFWEAGLDRLETHLALEDGT